MRLPPEQAERFYRIWWALLRFVNERQLLVPPLPEQKPDVIPIEVAVTIRQALWADDALLERFVAENPAKLDQAGLDLVASWRRRLSGRFIIMRHLKKHSVFLDEGDPGRAYGVVGLLSALDEVTPPFLPVIVDTVLLAFEDVIVYDGLIMPYNIMIGPGMRRGLEESYRRAREREGVITSLRPVAGPEAAEQGQRALGGRNTRVLHAFRGDLLKSGLSPQTAERHVAAVARFAGQHLAVQSPPRSVVDFTGEDIDHYLATVGEETAAADQRITSFKRFVRFLSETGRVDPETARGMNQSLKGYRVRR